MSIVAALDKVLFFNASSKYSVLRMKTEDSSVPAEARSPYRYHDHLIRFTAVGIELPQTDMRPLAEQTIHKLYNMTDTTFEEAQFTMALSDTE